VNNTLALFLAFSILPAPYNLATKITPPAVNPLPKEANKFLICAIVATADTLSLLIVDTIIYDAIN
jgi:hypothetical protein